LPDPRSIPGIPTGLAPFFQEYDLRQLDLDRDANLIMERVLEHGTWDELRWLFAVYGKAQICRFVQEHGERWLAPVTFCYWRKLLGIRRWQHSPFQTAQGEVWLSA
jgi:hypothetical protein